MESIPIAGRRANAAEFLGIESDRQNLLARGDIVTDRQISLLLWDRNVVEPGELFFLGCSTIAAAHKL